MNRLFSPRVGDVIRSLWKDECGAILSAEAALLGTVAVIGAGAGISAVAESVDEETKDVAFAIRSLDQSYSFEGTGDDCQCSKAWTAGSSFKQEPVEKAHEQLQHLIDELEASDEKTHAKAEGSDASDAKTAGKGSEDGKKGRDSADKRPEQPQKKLTPQQRRKLEMQRRRELEKRRIEMEKREADKRKEARKKKKATSEA